VVQQLIFAEQKLNNEQAADKARLRLKYLRTPTADWYFATKKNAEPSQLAVN
jgi:hypothetical protein